MSKVLRFFLKTALKYFIKDCRMGTKPRKVMLYEFKYLAEKGVYDKFEVGIGDFLAFGIAADEDARSSFSIAIVEMPDGTVRTSELNLIRFLQDPKI